MTDVAPRTIQAVEAELVRLRRENEQLRTAIMRILDLDANCRIALPPRDLALLVSLVPEEESAAATEQEGDDANKNSRLSQPTCS